MLALRPFGLALVCGVLAHQAQAQCRQALALALDVSGSVDAREYRLQMDGLATALGTSNVRGALLDQPGGVVNLMVYEWSGPADHTVVLPWTPVRDAAALKAIVAQLNAAQRQVKSPGTALGDAMVLGAEFLSQQPECWTRTLDISGDGKANLGARPRDIKPELQSQGITINALVIGADAPGTGDNRQVEIGELSAYFRAEVILGAGAFVETAVGFEDYADAMARKLERELQTMVLSDAAR
jgi:hypothetical protein